MGEPLELASRMRAYWTRERGYVHPVVLDGSGV